MRAPSVLTSLALFALAGCSSAPSPGRLVPENAPDWVKRGSRVLEGRIVGVGAVSGISNAPVAQSTALNRGRAEISRILDTYSASLMKDYQASVAAGEAPAEEGQSVEQAIKTFSANLLRGSEQRDMWLDAASNTWFALVELDFARQQRLASAGVGGGLEAWIARHGAEALADLESDLEERRAPATPDPDPALPAPASPRRAERDRAPARTGPRPAWVDGRCDPRFLCATGEGSTDQGAETRARTNMALIFEAQVRAVAESFQSASREAQARTGERWAEVERVTEHSLVTTEKLLLMCKIEGRWISPEGVVWAQARIEREPAARALRDRITSLDRVIGETLQQARLTAGLERPPILRRALQHLAERQALDADHRVLTGRGLPTEVTWADVLALVEDTRRELRLALTVAGPGAERIGACLEAQLTEAGHTLVEVHLDPRVARPQPVRSEHDGRLEGELRVVPRGRVGGDELVQSVLTLRLVNGRSGRLLRTVSQSEKATRPSRTAAVETAVTKLCAKSVPRLVADLGRTFGR